MPYFFSLLLTLAACFGVQALAFRAVGGRTAKSESNFFSSLARIQNGVREPQARIYLLGSSLTGRFPDRGSGFEEVANLGCDGGSAVDTLRAIDCGTLPKPEWLVIEGNTLYRATGSGQSEVARALDTPWFKFGRQFSSFSAAARPSMFLYGQLLARRTGQFAPPGESLPLTSVPLLPQARMELADEEDELVNECAAILVRLDKTGCRALVVFLPPGAPKESPNYRVSCELAARAGVEFWNLAEGLPEGAVRFTDGIHMDARSASATLGTILKGLQDD